MITSPEVDELLAQYAELLRASSYRTVDRDATRLAERLRSTSFITHYTLACLEKVHIIRG